MMHSIRSHEVSNQTINFKSLGKGKGILYAIYLMDLMLSSRCCTRPDGLSLELRVGATVVPRKDRHEGMSMLGLPA